jgi:SAM-dependent methyltransferase
VHYGPISHVFGERRSIAMRRMGTHQHVTSAMTGRSGRTLYGRIAARLYDHTSGNHSRMLASWICGATWLAQGRALDVGCGTGTLIRELGRSGWDCWGVDASLAMVDQARRRAGRSRVRVCDARRIQDRDAFALITAFGDVVNHIGTNAGLGTFLRRARRALQPQGHLIFDTLDPRDIDHHWSSYVEHTQRPGWSLVRKGRRTGKGRGEIAYEYFIRNRGGCWTRYAELHRLRAWQPRELEEMLQKAGLVLVKRLDADRLGALRASTVRWLIVARRAG